MDDTKAQTQNQTISSGSNTQGTDSGQARMTGGQQPVQPVQQPVPVAGVAKEKGPIPTSGVTEWVSPSTPEIVLPQEVKAAGVEVKPVVEKISESAQQAGVRMASQVATAPTVKAEALDLKTPRNVLEHLKVMHKSVKDGISWLVRLIIREQDKESRAS